MAKRSKHTKVVYHVTGKRGDPDPEKALMKKRYIANQKELAKKDLSPQQRKELIEESDIFLERFINANNKQFRQPFFKNSS